MSQNRLEEIRERFASNKGGYVYYTRNDESDFAYLALINPETNAITGMLDSFLWGHRFAIFCF